MEQIFIHVVAAILAALLLKVFRLNTKRVVVVQARPVSWVWKLLAGGGKILFLYGLLVFISNLLVNGPEAYNTRIGVSFLTAGLLAWIIGGIVIHFKRN